MASLKLEHIYKVYPNGHKAVSDFNMDIKDGEFIVFVGPSGCGKSTTLRMIAGLEEISAGELYIGDTLVNDMEPKERDIAMVFQNYALYPHMTVYENMAFGLTLRKMPRSEIHEKVMWAAEALGLKEYLDRKPKAMSGGQRQRVSLGRAILRNPKVMLLDEPLSNLDAKLRSQMRSVISKLHQSLATTFIYVTHDQVEAMTLGTRVCVMKLGRIQQVDTPQNLYNHPVNVFVAGFIGTPQMNFFNVTLKKGAKDVELNWCDCEQPALHADNELVLKTKQRYLNGDVKVILGLRCEAISCEPEEVAKGDNLINVRVSHFEELGNETLIYGDLKEVGGLMSTSKTSVIIKATSSHGFKPGDVVKARVDMEKCHLFDSESEMTIIPAIPSEDVLPISIENGKMDLFGKENKPDALTVDFVKDGFISIPLTAITVGEGSVKGKVKSVETINDKHLALIEVGDKSLFAFVGENVKAKDTVNLSIDYSLVTVLDAEEKVVCEPLNVLDDLNASFVNYKTAMEVTQNPDFEIAKAERVNKVNEEYGKLKDDLAKEKEAAMLEASKAQEAVNPHIEEKRAELLAANAKAKEDLKALNVSYKGELAAAKEKHAGIKKEAIKAIEDQYKKMLDDETKDYRLAISTNKDKEAIRARKLSYQLFKESYPAMKQNDISNKENALAFDSETEINGIKSRYAQNKYLLQSKIKEGKDNFEKECYPLKECEKVYAKKEAELAAKEKDALLHAELMFFFKFDECYQIIPNNITDKIIQGLGNKVFTKTFRVSVPHTGYVKAEKGLDFKVTQLVNYGDVKYYKCVGRMYDQDKVIYIRKTEELELGSAIKVLPKLSESEIYETALNIRLY